MIKNKPKALNEKEKEHDRRNCLFCHFEKAIPNKGQSEQETDDLDGEVKKVRNRRIEFKGKNAETWNEICFAIFANLSRTLGHALVITRSPFDDFTDTIEGKGDEEKLTTFNAAIWVARRIEDILGAEKVYITSMCDHWEIWETSDENTTEHLHFHLIPRYKGMRTKEQAGEKLLCREETKWDEKDLERFTKWFNKRLGELGAKPKDS
jgi:diadenosine tetraphosphate (Ap4A) HIT family hydrolase